MSQGTGVLVAPEVGSEGAVPTSVLAPNLRTQSAPSPQALYLLLSVPPFAGGLRSKYTARCWRNGERPLFSVIMSWYRGWYSPVPEAKV